jgi:hypothetical protein
MAIKTMKIEYLQKALEMADEFGYPGKSVTTARFALQTNILIAHLIGTCMIMASGTC